MKKYARFVYIHRYKYEEYYKPFSYREEDIKRDNSSGYSGKYSGKYSGIKNIISPVVKRTTNLI